MLPTYWNNKGIIEEQMGKTEDAVASYSKALYYDSKLYDARKKLRSLQNKSDLYKFFPATDVYALITKVRFKKPFSQDYDYSYLLDEKLAIPLCRRSLRRIFPHSFSRLTLKRELINGKDSYIPFNEYTQSLLIEKAEVVKKNGK
jgi:tetratricopeptide (TPR) repeat protein